MGVRHRHLIFIQVVDFCMEAKCRRKALLTHFGESLPPTGADAYSCCDVCSNKSEVQESINAVHAILSGNRARPSSASDLVDQDEDDVANFRRVMGDSGGAGGSGAPEPEGRNAHVKKPDHLTTSVGEGRAFSFASKIAQRYSGVNDPGFANELIAAEKRAEERDKARSGPGSFLRKLAKEIPQAKRNVIKPLAAVNKPFVAPRSMAPSVSPRQIVADSRPSVFQAAFSLPTKRSAPDDDAITILDDNDGEPAPKRAKYEVIEAEDDMF